MLLMMQLVLVMIATFRTRSSIPFITLIVGALFGISLSFLFNTYDAALFVDLVLLGIMGYWAIKPEALTGKDTKDA